MRYDISKETAPAMPNLGKGTESINCYDSDQSKTTECIVRKERGEAGVKDELQSTKIAITCYDKDGNIVKRVTSADTNDVEETEDSEGTGGSGSGDSGGGNGVD